MSFQMNIKALNIQPCRLWILCERFCQFH